MKKITIKRMLTIFLGLILTTSTFGCNKKESNRMYKDEPDYSNSNLQFEFYGYSGPSDGYYNEYGENFYTGEDYRTVERYKEYKDAGMTINFPQLFGAIGYGNTPFEESAAKMVIDRAREAGIEKTILWDNRIHSISKKTESNIGEGKLFASEAELDAYILDCLDDYMDYPGFYGVMIGDEPLYNHLDTYGEIARSIKRVAPQVFIHMNLVCCTSSYNKAFYGDDLDVTGLNPIQQRDAAWRRYLEKFLDETGADYIQYDQYPMYEQGITDAWMRGLQIAAEVARDRNVDLWVITQTMQMQTPTEKQRLMTEADARWLNNMIVGMGADGIGYFTYWRKRDNNGTEFFHDNASFISQYGQKTDMYYFMQKIMQEEQKLAPTILNFKYNESTMYTVAPPFTYSSLHYLGVQKGTMQKIKSASVDKEAVFCSELYDKTNNRYMYMLQNVIDPLNKGDEVLQTTTVTFSDEYNYAVVWKRGEKELVKLDNHTYTVQQYPGEAVYVIPY